VVRLTWQDVDLEAGRLTIHAPKTEHHEDGGLRFCPIFPELRPYLQELYDRANPGIDCPLSAPVITRWQSGEQNLRTAFQRLLTRAGVKAWPKLFHNMRASRQTELLAQFPAKDVCDWLGNSEAVAMKHYAMATADSFKRAVCGSTGGSISANQEPSVANTEVAKPLKNKGLMTPAGVGISPDLAEAGLERIDVTQSVASRLHEFVDRTGAKSGAVGARNDVVDADLARLTALWPMLPDDARHAVLGLAEKSVMLPATD